MPLTMTVFDSLRDVEPKSLEVTWDWGNILIAEGSWFRPEAIKQRSERSKCFSMVRYQDGAKRGQIGIEAITGLVFDIDNKRQLLSYDELLRLETLQGLACLIYPTWSYFEGWPRFRVVIPFDQEMPMMGLEHWKNFYDAHRELYFPGYEEAIDPSGRNPAQLWFGFYYKDEWKGGIHDYVFKSFGELPC